MAGNMGPLELADSDHVSHVDMRDVYGECGC